MRATADSCTYLTKVPTLAFAVEAAGLDVAGAGLDVRALACCAGGLSNHVSKQNQERVRHSRRPLGRA